MASDVNDLVRQIQQLQKETNDAIVRKQTAISKKQSIESDINQLKKKSIEQFGCDINMLANKKEQFSKQIQEKISILKKVLGL